MGIACVPVAIAYRKQRRASLLGLCLLVGWINTDLRTGIHSANDLRLRVGPEPVLATVCGRIVRSPAESGSRSETNRVARWRVLVDVKSVAKDDGRWPAAGRIVVFSEGPRPRGLLAGADVAVTGLVARPAPASAPGLFDYREKLRREGIHHQLSTLLPSDWRVVSGPRRPPMQDRFQQWAKDRFSQGLPGEDESLHLLWAMVLGWRAALTDQVAEPFMRSGTMHIFAISGLHIAMIAGVLLGLLRVVRIPRAGCGLVVVPFLWFYCAATGWQASATRATLMMSIVVLGWVIKRPVDLLNSVCAAALVILVWDPLQLLQASFQLSFSVVTTIAVLLPRFDAVKERLITTDPMMSEDLLSWWRQRMREFARSALAAINISICAWLGSMPLIAFYFNLWTPGCLLANPIVVLLAMCAICSALGGLLIAPLLPAVAILFNHGAWFWVLSQTWVSERTAALPGGWWQVPTPTLIEVAVYYLLLLGVGGGWIGKAGWRGGFTAVLTGGLVWMIGIRLSANQALEIGVLGHRANAVVLNLPGTDQDLLIDCGRKSALQDPVVSFLRTRGMSSLSGLLLTHGDIDHIESCREVREHLHPEKIYSSRIDQRSPTYRAAIRELREMPELWAGVVAGDAVGRWQVLHPPGDMSAKRADDAAVVLRGEFDGVWMLLTSDLGAAGQQMLLERGLDLSADILVTGVPRSGRALSDEFLASVHPELVIVQDERLPVEGRLIRSERLRIRQYAKQVFALSNAGSVCLRIADGEWHVFQSESVP